MGQLEVDAEAGCFDCFRVVEHEFFFVRGMGIGFIHLHIQHRSGDHLDFIPAQGSTKAEFQHWFFGRATAGAHHFRLTHPYATGAKGFAREWMSQLDIGIGQPQLVDRGVGEAIAAHGGIAQGQSAARIGACQGLQPMGTWGRKTDRLTRDVRDLVRIERWGRWQWLDQILTALPICDRRINFAGGAFCRHNCLLCWRSIQQIKA